MHYENTSDDRRTSIFVHGIRRMLSLPLASHLYHYRLKCRLHNVASHSS